MDTKFCIEDDIAAVVSDITRFKAQVEALRDTCTATAAETSVLKKKGVLLDEAIKRAEQEKKHEEIYILALWKELAKWEKTVEELDMLLQEQKMLVQLSEHSLVNEGAAPKGILPVGYSQSSCATYSPAGSAASSRILM